MTKRNPLLVVALTFVTLTLYAYYWLYRTTEELRAESGRDELHPVVDVVLAALTFGIWGLWAGYRNARIVHELFEQDGVKHTDRSAPVAIFAALSMVSGWAWLMSMAILQEDLNRLAGHLEDLDHAPLADAQKIRAAAGAGAGRRRARSAARTRADRVALGGRTERPGVRVERARADRVLSSEVAQRKQRPMPR